MMSLLMRVMMVTVLIMMRLMKLRMVMKVAVLF